jgi:hypothetical protein
VQPVLPSLFDLCYFWILKCHGLVYFSPDSWPLVAARAWAVVVAIRVPTTDGTITLMNSIYPPVQKPEPLGRCIRKDGILINSSLDVAQDKSRD